MGLTEEHVKVLSYVEQMFWETGYVPTNEKASRDLSIPMNRIGNMYKNNEFKAAAMSRGIDIAPDDSAKVLEPRQLLLANMLMNTLDKKSLREKLGQIGVSPQQYQAWRRQPAFQKYLQTRAEAVFKDSDTEAYLGLAKAVQAGDLNAIKFHMEVRGTYNPRIQVDVNIEQVLVRIVDVVSQHVSPEVMEAIGNDLDAVLGGANMPALEPAKKKPIDIGGIDI